MECPTLNLIKIWESQKTEDKNNNLIKTLNNENYKSFDVSLTTVIKDDETNITKL
jgi:hypothetical protein